MASDTKSQVFSFDVVACLVAALLQSGTVVGQKHYKLMHQLDDSRTESGYEHLFRKVKSRAKEIHEGSTKVEREDFSQTATPTKKGMLSSKNATPIKGEKMGSKRTRKYKALDDTANESEIPEDCDDAAPRKKVKIEQEYDE